MKIRLSHPLVWSAIVVVYLALLAKVGDLLLAVETVPTPPLLGEFVLDQTTDQPRLVVRNRPLGAPAPDAVVLPAGPDDLGLPGISRYWQEMADALEGRGREGKHGFDGLQAVSEPLEGDPRIYLHLQLAERIVDLYRYQGHAYLLGSDGRLLILDLDRAHDPVLVRSLEFDAPVRSMAAEGETLYLLLQETSWPETTLLVVDLSEPSQPRQVTRHDLPLGTEFINAFGNYLVAHSWPHGSGPEFLQVYDLTEPAQLAPLQMAPPIGSDWHQLKVGRFWFAAALRGGLNVFDMADPARPRPAARLDLRDRLRHLTRVGSRMFAWGSSGRLYLIDISDPQSPAILAEQSGSHLLVKVAFVEGYTYLFSNSGTLHVIDRLPPRPESGAVRPLQAKLLAPRLDETGFERLGGAPDRYDRLPWSLAGSDEALLDVQAWNGKFLVLTTRRLVLLEDDGGPKWTLRAELPLPGEVLWLAAADQRIYLGGTRLFVVRWDSAAGLLLGNSVPLGAKRTWTAVTLQGNLLVAAGKAGLLRFDLNDPDDPQPRPGWQIPRHYAALVDIRHLAAGCGTKVFAAAGEAGLLSGQLSPADGLVLNGRLAFDRPLRRVVLAAGICLAATASEVAVVDVRKFGLLQKIGAIGLTGVDSLAVAPPRFWAGRVPGRGWTVLPLPRFLLPESAAGRRLHYQLPELPAYGFYRINLFNEHGVTPVPGALPLILDGRGA